jgi:hypothetical protein
VVHGDLNTGNLLLDGDTVVGLVDFGDVRNTIRMSELAIACAYTMLCQDDPVTVAAQVCAGYREFCLPSATEASALFGLILGRLATSVCVSASLPRDNPHRHDTADATWDLLSRLVAADMSWISEELRAAALGGDTTVRGDRSVRRDPSVLGPSLSLSYDDPLHIVHGSGQYLSNYWARRYRTQRPEESC